MSDPTGAERTDEFTVVGPLLTDVGGTIPSKVLSTPGMIGMMERNAAMLALEHLDDGKATVGFEVCIKHLAAGWHGARAAWASTTDGATPVPNPGVAR